MSKKPPRIAVSILRRILPVKDRTYLMGDYEESFQRKLQEKSALSASLWYWGQLIGTAPEFFLEIFYWRMVMFKNYVKIAFRNIKRHKIYSFINIAGLSLGTAACILIILYLHFELSYDKYFKNSSRIFRVTNDFTLGDTHRDFATIPGPAGPAFAEGIPEILDQARALRLNPRDRKLTITKESENYEETNVYLVDSTFFNIFDYEFILGDRRTALKEPNTIVLTEKSAKKMFGNEDPIGKILRISAARIGDLLITGVVENPPENTHFKFDYLIPLLSLDEDVKKQGYFDDWGYFSFYTYVLLDENANPDVVAGKMNLIYEKNSGEQHRKIGAEWNYSIQKMTDIHLRSHLSNEIEANNNIEYIYLQFVVALLIIVIACSNFINLFIAKSTARAKEVGLRKVFGAVKRNIKDQIIGESALMVVLSILTGLYMVIFFLPVFNSLTGLSISPSYIFQKQILLSLGALIIVATLMAGVYPSIVLSRFQPVVTIKNTFQGVGKRNYLRRSLVVIQFIISISLIFSTIVVLKQLNFMKNKNLGFDKEQVVVVNWKAGSTASDGEVFKEMLKTNPNIIEASFSDTVPGKNTGVNAFLPEGFSKTNPQMLETAKIDFDFLKTYKLEIVHGRSFSRESGTDPVSAYVINESAARLLGWSNEEAIGKRFDNLTDGNKDRMVIGILKDYHHKSLKQAVDPMAFSILPRAGRYLSIKVSTENLSETISFIEEKWNGYTPGLDFEYFFVDENFDSLYHSEENLFSLFEYFAFLAILISCLGLFAMAAYTAEQKKKEIGIRKVLGANVSELVILLLRSSLGLVILASIIALPAIYYILNLWLRNFAFKIEISIWWYVISLFTALILSVFSTAFQTIKASLANPVVSLRNE